MGPSEDGHAVGPDLVRCVAVPGDPVRAHHDQIHLATLHEVPGHVVGDECGGDAGLGELPGGQPSPLQKRASLVHPDLDSLPGFHRRADDPDGCPVPRCGESPGVTVGEDAGRIRDQRLAVSAYGAIDADVLLPHRLGFRHETRLEVGNRQIARLTRHTQHPADRPGEVDRGRSGADELVADLFEGGAERRMVRLPDHAGAQGQPHGRCDADGRRPAHLQGPDGVGHLVHGSALQIDFLQRESCLIDQANGPLRGPGDCRKVVVHGSISCRQEVYKSA